MPFFHRAHNIEMEGSDDPVDGHVVAQFNVMHVFNVVYCNCGADAARNVTESLIMKVKVLIVTVSINHYNNYCLL